jgi:ElaB/YqjD/DUF883 family membrane-anchored ribosome-binding protein
MSTMNDPLASGMSRESNESFTNGGVKAKLSDATSHVRNTAADFGRSAVENIDRNLKNAAGALESTASAIRSKLPAEGGRMSGAAHTAVEKLDATARYLRTHDTHDLMTGLESWTRRNPGAAIGGALALGFLIGMSLNRDRRDNY